MARPLKILSLIFLVAFYSESFAAIPDTCRHELDETYNSAADEAALTIALQNLGLCLELELYPKDVKEFLSQESTCIHIAGEEPYSGERAVELERLNKQNNCDTNEMRKDTLLKKYHKDENIVRALKNYGNKIYPGNESAEPFNGEGEAEPPAMNMLPPVPNNNSGGGVI